MEGRFPFTILFFLHHSATSLFDVNGILTGLFIPDEVVWYNNDEILGLRVLTIPVEDFFYGMLLLLLNTAGMEYLLERRKKK